MDICLTDKIGEGGEAKDSRSDFEGKCVSDAVGGDAFILGVFHCSHAIFNFIDLMYFLKIDT